MLCTQLLRRKEPSMDGETLCHGCRGHQEVERVIHNRRNLYPVNGRESKQRCHSLLLPWTHVQKRSVPAFVPSSSPDEQLPPFRIQRAPHRCLDVQEQTVA